MKWSDHVLRHQPEAALLAPASRAAIDEAETKLSVSFPKSLRSLLLESNGVHDIYGSSFIWSVQEIVERNIEFRTYPEFAELYMPFNNLLFFGDAGNGDQFFFPVLANEIRKHDVFAWNHENDSRFWVAPRLETFVEWWFTGKIKL